MEKEELGTSAFAKEEEDLFDGASSEVGIHENMRYS